MMSSESTVRAAVVVLLLLSWTGCQKSTESSDHHADDHEHLEHFVPPHKPASFEELVSQLMSRCETLPRLAEADEMEFQKRSLELRDIILWVPELAADSNLKRQEFQTAVNEGNELLKAFEASSAGRTLRMETVQKNLDTLKAIVPESIEVAPQ